MANEPQTQVSSPGGLHSEASIFSILTQLGATQFVLAFTGVVRNKVIAYRLGPAAFGELAQIATAMSVVYALVTFGMAVSLARNAASAKSREERRDQLATANGMVLALAAAATAVALVLLASGRLLGMAAVKQQTATVVATGLFIASIPIEAIRNNYLSFLQGILDVRGVAARRSVAVLLATVVAIPVVWFFGLIGAAVQFFLLSLLVAVVLGWRCHTLGYAPLRIRLDKRVGLGLASFGIVSMASGFAQAFADAAVRSRLIETAGAAPNGILQAAFTVSMTLKAVVLASIGSISLATIAPRTDGREISAAMDRLLNVVIPLSAAALGLLGLLGAPALTVLYSKEFASGAALFPYILIADLILVFVWVIGAPLLSYGDRVLWLALDLLYAFARWCVAIVLVPRLGNVAVVIAYLAAAAVHFGLNLAVCRLRYRLYLDPKQIYALLFGIGLAGALSVLGASQPASIPAVLSGIAVWCAYAAQHARRSDFLSRLARR